MCEYEIGDVAYGWWFPVQSIIGASVERGKSGKQRVKERRGEEEGGGAKGERLERINGSASVSIFIQCIFKFTYLCVYVVYSPGCSILDWMSPLYCPASLCFIFELGLKVVVPCFQPFLVKLSF